VRVNIRTDAGDRRSTRIFLVWIRFKLTRSKDPVEQVFQFPFSQAAEPTVAESKHINGS
jgi:hypothetical protein